MLLSGNYTSQYWISLLYSIPAILIALSFHEFAHAFVAYRLGDPTAKMKGRMTIDPSKHLDIFGTICMIFCGFGWAKPVPIDIRNFKKPRRDTILVSVAGVCMNLIVAFAAYAIFFAVTLNTYNETFVNIIVPIITLNVALAVFNIIPVPPLDGFHIVEALCIRKRTKAVFFLYKYGWIILLVLVFTGVVDFLLSFITQPILNAFAAFFSLFM